MSIETGSKSRPLSLLSAVERRFNTNCSFSHLLAVQDQWNNSGETQELFMMLYFSLLGGLLLLNASAIAQTACRQAIGRVVERSDTFTVVSISLPSQPASVAATAVIANNPRAAGAYVFSLYELVGSDSEP